MLRITLFGAPTVSWHDQALDIPRRTVRALLFVLAAQPQPMPRAQLALLFFGDVAEAEARTRLRRALSQLRGALNDAGVEPDLIRADDDTVSLDAPRLWCDVREFERASGEIAAVLHNGAFLAGFELPDAPDFEHWVMAQRERLSALQAAALRDAARARLANDDLSSARRHAAALVQHDPLNEEAHLLLIEALARGGERAAATRQYDTLKQLLARELGVAPLPASEARYTSLLGGLSAPMPALSAHAPAAPDIPFAGREHDLGLLHAVWLAGDGQPAFSSIAVIAVAGQGKTRLVDTFAQQLRSAGAGAVQPLMLRAACYPSTQELPYHPIAESLRPLIDPATAGSELAHLLPALARGAAPLSAEVSGFDARSRMWHAVASLLETHAQRQPLLWIIDDAHWCDPGSLQLLPYLARRLAGVPVALLLTIRSEETSAALPMLSELERLPRHRTLHLAPLRPEDVHDMVRRVLGPTHDGAQLAARLHQESEGNALFCVEMLRGVIERRAAGAGDAADTHLPLPDTVRKAIAQRFDQLSPLARQVMGAAAVIGRTCPLSVLRRVSGKSESALADAIDELARAHVLQDQSDAVRFAHIKLQEVAYHELTSARRRLLHNRAAEALMQRVQARRADALDVVYHAERAQRWPEQSINSEAAEWYARAATRARTAYATDRAVSLYGHALQALGCPLPETPVATAGGAQSLPAGAIDLYAGMGEMLRWQGKYSEARNAFVAMRNAAEQAGDRQAQAMAWRGEAYVHNNAGDHASAIACSEQAARIATEIGADNERAHALYGMGWALSRLGRLDEALSCAQTALRLALGLEQASGDRTQLAQCLNLLGVVRNQLGDYHEAVGCLEPALEIYRATGNRNRMATMLINLGEFARMRGDAERAIPRYEEALAVGREIGNRELERIGLLNLGSAQVSIGRHAAAIGNLNAALALLSGTPWGGASEAHAMLCEAHLGLNQCAAALAAASEALRLAYAQQRPENRGVAWRAMGLALAAAEHARMDATEAKRVIAAVDNDVLVAGDAADACFSHSALLLRGASARASLVATLHSHARHARAHRAPAERIAAIDAEADALARTLGLTQRAA